MQHKKILFDLLSAQPVGDTKFHGGGEYIKTVFKKLIECYRDNVYISVFYDRNKFIDTWISDLIERFNVPIYNTVNIKDVSNVLQLEKFDVFYSGLPYAYTQDIFPYEIKKIGTFHGMRPIECPGDKYEYLYMNDDTFKAKVKKHLFKNNIFKQIWDYRQKRSSLKTYDAALKCFDKCVVVSEHTKYAVCNYFPKYKNRIEVCYSPSKVISEVIEKNVTSEDYILIISANRWLKNSYRALKALDDMYGRNLIPNFKVVVVGMQDKEFISRIKNRQFFQFRGYVSTKELEELYSHCKVFLYPTLNEGFGYPPLEAMNYGRTCIVSAVCSLPEICGESVYYINPYDLGEIQTRILTALEHNISDDVIYRQRNKILYRQNLDLDKLCKLIVNG